MAEYKVEKFPFSATMTCYKITNLETGKVAKAKVYSDGCTPTKICDPDPFFKSANDMTKDEINAEYGAMMNALLKASRQ